MPANLRPDMTMDAVMRNWPAAIRVLLDRGLFCVGCPIASLHTVADAAREHGVDEAGLLRDLIAAIAEERPASDKPA